jgi:hypothetical protein
MVLMSYPERGIQGVNWVLKIGIGGRETAPLPHHRACGSAPGGSVKYDEVDIVLKS